MTDQGRNLDMYMPMEFVRGLVRAAALSGISVEPVLKSEGIDPDKMRSLALSKLAKVVNYLVGESPFTTLFPLMRVINDEAIEEMLTIASTSKNLIEGANNMMEVGPFSALGLELRYSEGEEFDTYEVSSSSLEGVANDFLIKVLMAASVRFLPAQFHGNSVVEKVEFSIERDGEQNEYELYFGCPVEFNQPHNHIYFKPNTVNVDIQSHSPSLCAAAMDTLKQATHILLSLQGYRFRVSQTVSDLVQDRIQNVNNGSIPSEKQDYSIEKVASLIGINVRSLQRKLKQEHSSFLELKNRTLIEESKKWMDRGQSNLDIIAETFGYSDRAAFSKVFKKYTQVWPAQYMAS